MIFSDEPRFSKKLVSHPVDGSIVGISKSSTEDHVGPGSYLAKQFEERRSGWQRASFSNRQPMQEPKNSPLSRSDYYRGGVLSPNGTMAMPASPARSHSPGPGHYEAPNSIFSFPTDPHRRQDLNLTSMSGASVQNISTRPTNMASTPRFAFSNSVCLKQGVMFQSAANDASSVGPGYYSVPRNDFLKRSYNIRVRGADNRVRSASNTPVTTPVKSPSGMIRPSTQVRQISTPRGSYRPSSASSAGPSSMPRGAAAAGNIASPGGPGTPMMMSPAKAAAGQQGQGQSTPNGGSVSGAGSLISTPQSGAGAAGVSRPRSASAGITGRSGGQQRATPNGAGAGVTPTRSVALAGRGQGLFSEHGTMDKSKTQQQWQQEQQQAPVANGKRVPI